MFQMFRVAKTALLWQSVTLVMRRSMFFSVLLGFSAGSAPLALSQGPAAKTSDPVARVHFVGFDQLALTTNAATLNEIWKMPETIQLRQQLLDKLARALASSFRPRTDKPGAAPDAALRSLFPDLFQRESYLEITKPADQSSAWTLAIQLDAARSRVWETNWLQLTEAWNCVTASGTNRLTFATVNSWFVIQCVSGAANDNGNHAGVCPVFRQISAKGRPVDPPKDYLLKANANLASFNADLPFFAVTNQPMIELSVAGKGPRLRSEARVLFPKPIRWQLEKWQIPANTIRDPQGTLISFTGAQGLAPWLSGWPPLREFGVNPAPNQLFAWGDSHAPFQIMAAAPVRNMTNVLARFAMERMPKLNATLSDLGAGSVEFQTNHSTILWRGLAPIIVPYLRPASEPGKEFLQAGIFPMEDTSTNPPPSELLGQLTSRANLLYYDWEITQERLAQLRSVAPYFSTFLDIPTLEAGLVSSKWLEAIQPKLVNTVTEISVVSGRELKLVRSSEAGFNGLELVALAHWFESASFPNVNWPISFQPPAKSRKQAANP